MAPVLRHCPCLRPENDDVRLLDYSHSNLDDVPNEVFGFERTLEELFLDANQIKDLPRVILISNTYILGAITTMKSIYLQNN